ncbi:Thiol-disulfide isomerase or thioredoxin [Pustulibacterium marinum]|uniref:Thiol-disulfide isomerase or thioredoxin n=1 Tax=Pustulibacterium marinum TaxID=1224947 RepID=A0A1I7FR14_9FLAO|nr:TlpA disulfide reductase family protein [Pustulibacterium marinum]SFU38664.1 Thiol-disulfide isomerase or thioredoxin [Pustulibacterium marinum]
MNRLLAFSPSIENVEDRKTLSKFDYDFRLQTLNGEQVKFNNFKGNVVIVNFWATWCPPCIAEMPSLQNLYNDYGDKVAFLFISNEESSVIASFLQKHEYDLPVYQNLQKVPSKLGHSSIPTTYLIDKNGSIVINKTGAADWNSGKTRSLLDELIAE